MKDPPQRTTTYERPFTQEGNYLVYYLLTNSLATSIYYLQLYLLQNLF